MALALRNLRETLSCFHLDPRLKAELLTQKRPLGIGFICTVVGSSSAGFAVLLLKRLIDILDDLAKSVGELANLPKNLALHKISPKTYQADLVAIHLRQSQGMEFVIAACASIVILYAARYWFVRGQTYYLSEASNRLAMNLRLRMLSKLLNLPISYFNDRRTGSIQSVLTNDVNVYQVAVGLIRDSVGAPFKAIPCLIIVFVLQWRLALISCMVVPFMAFVIQRNSRKMRVAQRQVQEDLASLNATTVEVLQGTRVVKAFGAEDATRDQYYDLVETTFQSQMRAAKITAELGPSQDFLGATSLAIVLYVCGLFAKSGELGLGSIFAIGYSLDQVNQGLRALGGITNTYASVQSASDRIYAEILDIPESHEVATGRVLSEPIGEIRFEHVSFCYPDGTAALDDVSFVIPAGTSLALVGPSGAGKSTIADLMLRFYDPSKGRILFDGVDIRTLDIRWLRSQVGVVPQQTFLFAGTIEDNVRVGKPDATEDEVELALNQAHAKEFTQEIKGRVTSELGERGVRLSGGQMQRVAIARALVRKPKMLLLDEATSALDATSEKLVTEALAEVMKTRTTLFIAHRLTTAARADRILVLSRGNVMEVGSHQELLAANGTYAALFQAFSGGILS